MASPGILMSPDTSTAPTPEHVALQEKFERGVEEAAQLVQTIREYQEIRYNQQLAISNGAFTNLDDLNKAQAYLAEVDEWLTNLWVKNAEATTTASQNFYGTLKWLHAQLIPLSNEIVKWKGQQRIAVLGGPDDNLNNHLFALKQQFETLESLAWALGTQIEKYILNVKDMENLNRHCEQFLTKCRAIGDECQKTLQEVNKFKAKLMQKSLLVYQQPPSVVRRSGNANVARNQKGSKIPFDLELRFCIGEKSGLLSQNLEVEALLISEQQAKEIFEGKNNPLNEKFPQVGNLSYPPCTLQAPSLANDFFISAKFNKARVQNVEKAAEDDASRVMYHILFRAKLTRKRASNGTINYCPFWAVSLPFSVVINANRQEKYKKALMFWQISFATDDKTSLSLNCDEKNEKTKIPWHEFFAALNYWFKKNVGVQKGLEQQEQYIQEKINLNSASNYMGGQVVNWDMFYRRKNDQTNLTFWEWLYPATEYVSRFPSYWDSGLILGFASRGSVEHILSRANATKEPSMVLKFSDSRPGKMVASYINWTPTQLIEHVIFDEDDDPVFTDKTLIDCIRMSTKLQHVVKILPINKPISELYQLESTTGKKTAGKKEHKPDGYVKPGLVFVWGDPPQPPVYNSNISLPILQNAPSPTGSGYDPNVHGYTNAGYDASNPGIQTWLQQVRTPNPSFYPGENSQSTHSFESIDSGSGNDQFGGLMPINSPNQTFLQAAGVNITSDPLQQSPHHLQQQQSHGADFSYDHYTLNNALDQVYDPTEPMEYQQNYHQFNQDPNQNQNSNQNPNQKF